MFVFAGEEALSPLESYTSFYIFSEFFILMGLAINFSHTNESGYSRI
jgi:hypothetical protein